MNSITATSDSQDIPVDRQRWVGAPRHDRLHALHTIFIRHKDVRVLIEHIETQLQISAVRGSADGVLVIAASGAGKTTTIEQLQKLYPNVITPTLTTRPVVKLDIPKSLTQKSLGAAMLQALGDPAYESGGAQAKFERIEVLLKDLGTKIIAIDNFHDIPARRRVKGIAEIGDWFRDLCSMRFPGIVLAFGTEEAAIVRDSNPQLRRRMQARFELRVFGIETPEDARRWKWLLDKIDDRLPLAENSNLSSKQLAGRISVATAGNFDYLIKLLEKALIAALDRGSERIELGDLEIGFSKQHHVAAEGGNPFNDTFTGDSLTDPGQIFHLRSADGDGEKSSGRSARKTESSTRRLKP